MEYGSLFNEIKAKSKSATPVVGMGVTYCGWSDREPYEIITVTDSRHITVRRLDAKRIDNNGVSDAQSYEYYSNPNNPTTTLFLNANGIWVEKSGKKVLSRGWFIGKAEKYYDYTF